LTNKRGLEIIPILGAIMDNIQDKIINEAYQYANSNCSDEFGSFDDRKRTKLLNEKIFELTLRECMRVRKDLHTFINRNSAYADGYETALDDYLMTLSDYLVDDGN
jgi:hypothetical protein